MNGLRFTRPSVRRAIGFIAVTAVALSAITGLVLAIGAVAAHDDAYATTGGEYVRLFILDIVFWGPMTLLAIWQASVPLILCLGLVAAAVRRAPAA